MGAIATASGMFAAANIDDAVVLTLLNIAHRSGGTPTRTAIWLGQFIGIALIVAMALLGALALSLLPPRWGGLLGVIPVARGIWLAAIVFRLRGGGTDAAILATGVGLVIAVTFANGGDNIALYTPAFRFMTAADTALTIAVFAVATAMWCAVAALLISHRTLVRMLTKASRWLVPMVLKEGGFV